MSSFTGVSRSLWRYSSIGDLLAIARAAALTSFAFFPLAFLLQRLDQVPRSVPIIQFMLMVGLLGGSRLIHRLWYSSHARPARGQPDERKPLLLVGAGARAASFIRTLAAMAAPPFRVVGIIDPHPQLTGRRIDGVPILGRLDELAQVVERLSRQGEHPSRLVVTEPLNGSVLRKLAGTVEAAGMTMVRLPDPVELRNATEEEKIQLQQIPLADLLGRPPVALDRELVENLLRGRRILVTGAGGSIGSELVRQVLRYQPGELVLLENGEYALYNIDKMVAESGAGVRCGSVLADIRDRDQVFKIFAEAQPDFILHAAALKHVPLVELNPVEGVRTNVLGTRNVADAALACGAKAMIQISTDKAVAPTSVMGASKRLAEFYCQALDMSAAGRGPGRGAPRFLTVRFGNVLGSSGSVVPLFRQQLAAGGPLTVTHPEIKRYFMTIPEAVELVLGAVACGIEKASSRGQIFVLDMGEPIRIADLAKQMIRLAGREPGRDIEIRFTGLRPGEKLFEELFDASEERLLPITKGVLTARPRSLDPAVLNQAINDLTQACQAYSAAKVLNVLERWVPGYVSTRPGESARAA